MLKALKRTIQTMITRSLQSAINDEVERQVMQIKALDGEVFDNVERWQQYGHTSVSPKGSEQLVVALGGNRSNLAVICSEHKKHRLKGLKEGDSALYHQEGHYFKLTENGVAELDGETLIVKVKTVEIEATESVTVTTPKTTFTGDVEVGGNVAADGTIEGKQGGTFKGINSENHNHNYTDDGVTRRTEKPNA